MPAKKKRTKRYVPPAPEDLLKGQIVAELPVSEGAARWA